MLHSPLAFLTFPVESSSSLRFAYSSPIGTINFLTPDVVAAAGREIQDGTMVSLNLPIQLPAHPYFGRPAASAAVISALLFLLVSNAPFPRLCTQLISDASFYSQRSKTTGQRRCKLPLIISFLLRMLILGIVRPLR